MYTKRYGYKPLGQQGIWNSAVPLLSTNQKQGKRSVPRLILGLGDVMPNPFAPLTLDPFHFSPFAHFHFVHLFTSHLFTFYFYIYFNFYSLLGMTWNLSFAMHYYICIPKRLCAFNGAC